MIHNKPNMIRIKVSNSKEIDPIQDALASHAKVLAAFAEAVKHTLIDKGLLSIDGAEWIDQPSPDVIEVELSLRFFVDRD